MLQSKLIDIKEGFQKISAPGLSSFQYITKCGLDIVWLTINKNANIFIGSVFDPKYEDIQDDVYLYGGTSQVMENLSQYGIRATDLNAIQTHSGIGLERILAVFGGTNLFWLYADFVYFQNGFHMKNVPNNSLWYGKQYYCFYQTKTGQSGIELMDIWKTQEHFREFNLAVSGRPILLDGLRPAIGETLGNGLTLAEHFALEKGDGRHLFDFPKVIVKNKKKDKYEEYYFGMQQLSENRKLLADACVGESITIKYDNELFPLENLCNALHCWASKHKYRYELDLKRGAVIFPDGLPRNVYPHNVLAVDQEQNIHFVQFHGKSGQEGPLIEDMQDELLRLGIRSAIVTSNGLDVFFHNVRDGLYKSQSRILSRVKALEDRPLQHLLFIYVGE